MKKREFYTIRVRYSNPNEIQSGVNHLIFERYHSDIHAYAIMQFFPLEYIKELNAYSIPVEALRYIQNLNSYGYDVKYLQNPNLPYEIL